MVIDAIGDLAEIAGHIVRLYSTPFINLCLIDSTLFIQNGVRLVVHGTGAWCT